MGAIVAALLAFPLTASAHGGLVARYFPAYGGAVSLAVGAGGALWLDFGKTIERVSLSGRARVFRIPGVSSVSAGAIAAGADGALWFNEDTADCGGGLERFGRITLTGRVSHVVIPGVPRHKAINTIGPVQGSDGNMWFASSVCEAGPRRGLIGRITPRGQVRQWTVGFPPAVIARGPDQQMWLTSGSDQEVSISATGRITPHRLTLSSPITSGPDAAFWAPSNHGILRVRVNGHARLYPYLPDDTTNTSNNVAPGPHNDVWFTRETTDTGGGSNAESGSIDSHGRVQTIPLGDGFGEPTGITAAPDGAVWVAQFYGPLARITTRTKTPVPSPRVRVLHLTVSGRHASVSLRCEGLLGTFCSDALAVHDRSGRLVSPTTHFTVAAQNRLNITLALSRPYSLRAVHLSIR